MTGTRDRRRAARRAVGAVVATVAVLAASELTLPAPTNAAAARRPPAAVGPAGVTPTGKVGPLSPRLHQLSRPELATASASARAAAVGLPAAGAGSLIERDGGILVDIRVTDASLSLQARLRDAGASITFVDAATNVITATVPTSKLDAVAAIGPEVLSVREVPAPQLSAACPTGDFVSEGDSMLRSAVARTHHGVDGTGVTVGIISDSYAQTSTPSAATDVLNGELPGVTNPCGKLTPVTLQSEGAGGADEGRAMAQIVHDIAPGATIRMATAFNGQAAFAEQIRDLAATAGAKVIVDDATYFYEPIFQDGVIAQAVQDVSAAGVAYFSAAGNSNWTLNNNNSNSYESMAYRPTTCPAVIDAIGGYSDCHDFDAGPGLDPTYGLTMTAASSQSTFVFGWNEPQFGVVTDFDIFMIDHSTGNLVTWGTNDSLGDGVASEIMTSPTQVSNVDIVIARYQGANPTPGGTPRLKLIDGRAQITAMEYPFSSGTDVVGPTMFGHSAARRAVTVGAVPYDNGAALERYSSQGPATYCWGGVVGSVAADPLPACETTTIDLVATDGGQNSFFGSTFSGIHRFYGTSAAAPHAAAVAALVLQKAPCLTGLDVISVLRRSAASMGSFSVDAVGSGRVDADAAINSVLANPYRCNAVGAGAPSGSRTIVSSATPPPPPGGRAAAPAAPGG